MKMKYVLPLVIFLALAIFLMVRFLPPGTSDHG